MKDERRRAYYPQQDELAERMVRYLAYVGGVSIALLGMWGLRAFALYCTTLV